MSVGDWLVNSLIVSTAHQLEDETNGYTVVRFGHGAANLRRNTLESPDVDGRVLISWAEDVVIGTLVVRVLGANANQLHTRMNTLIGWLRQEDYTLQVDLALPGTPTSKWTEKWTCEPADYAYGQDGAIDEVKLANLMQDVTFMWPHSPIPAA